MKKLFIVLFLVFFNFCHAQLVSTAGIMASSGYFTATGGSITYIGGYAIHTYTANGTFTPNRTGNVDYLVIGGGGAGGSTNAGGGGAGGFLTGTGLSVTAQTYTITVGTGGTDVANGVGGNGTHSIFSSIDATGGGGGGTLSGGAGKNGGSGGGGASDVTDGTPSTVPGTGIGGQGFAGGTGIAGPTNNYQGAGGGGASAVGHTSTVDGNGGAGTLSALNGAPFYYSGGGAGGGNGGIGIGGIGGGGDGGQGVSVNGFMAARNTGGGGGGGGAGAFTAVGGAGASGVVIIRYPNHNQSVIAQVVFEGNSFFDPTASNTPASIVTTLNSDGINYVSSNYAISGSTVGATYSVTPTIRMLQAARLTAVQNAYSSIYKNILCTNEVLNNLNINLINGESVANTVANTYSNMVTYASTTVGYGYKLIINTASPATGLFNDANYEIARQNASNKKDTTTINGKLRTVFDIPIGLRLFASSNPVWANCILADYGNDPLFGQAGQAANTTYYVDHIHPTSTMKGLLSANYFSPAIEYFYTH